MGLNRGAEHLEPYFHLIAFAAYLVSGAFDRFREQGRSKITFKNWHQKLKVQAK